MMTADTVNKIAEFVYLSQKYDSIIKGMITKSALRYEDFEDVKQEIYVQILTSNNNIIDMWNKCEFVYWFIVVCNRQIKSQNSASYYKYVKSGLYNHEFLEEEHSKYDRDIHQRIDDVDRYDYVMDIVERNSTTSQMHKKAFECWKMFYINDWTMDMIGKKTNISDSSVYNYIRFAREFLKTNIDVSLFTDKENYDNTDNIN